MRMNGIDYTARMDALAAAGIDWDSGDHTQFGTPSVYCNQHLAPHLTALSSCNVHNVEKFALTADTYDGALAEAREKGFYIYQDARPCANCGVAVDMNDKDETGSARCVSEGGKRAPFHAASRDRLLPSTV